MREIDVRTLWHGGAPGLAVGDRIIPRAKLPTTSFDRILENATDPTLVDRVYLTTDRDFAFGWAVRYGNMPYPGARHGALYAVTAIGELRPDPDFEADAGAWTAEEAIITEVDKRRVKGPPQLANKHINRFARWSDDTPVYTPDGYLRVAPVWAVEGVVESDLRQFGRWVSLEEIGYDFSAGRMSRRPSDEAEQRAIFRLFKQQQMQTQRAQT